MNVITTCRKCDISILNGYYPVWGDGNHGASLMFIGEAPGYHEAKHKIPFVGASGKLLTIMLEKFGFYRNTHYYITNIVKCRPPANRDPSYVEQANCLPYIQYEIKSVNPAIIVLVGAAATKAYFNKPDLVVGRIRSRVIKIGHRTIISIYHPAYVLRNKTKLVQFVTDIKLIYTIYRTIVNKYHIHNL